MEVFGWLKEVGGFRRTRYRGVARTQLAGYMVANPHRLRHFSRRTQPGPDAMLGDDTPEHAYCVATNLPITIVHRLKTVVHHPANEASLGPPSTPSGRQCEVQ